MNYLSFIYLPFSTEAFETFNAGLEVTIVGMLTVISVLFLFNLIVRVLIKLFPAKK